VKYIWFILLFLSFGLLSLHAQISIQKPIKSNTILNRQKPNFLRLPSVDIARALKEDYLEMESKEVALRFGIPLSLSADFFSKASFTLLPDGSGIYRLGISAVGASSLNFTFNYFDLTEGSWMHIYNPSKQIVLGAFTEENERQDKFFATSLIASDSVIIEVYSPFAGRMGKIIIDKVIYGYRNLSGGAEQFGSSGSCNINVACPEGQAWKDQVQAVVLILTGGANNRMCTGTLINNVNEDGSAFMLSADHCPISNNNVAIFNYQSSDCSPSKDSSFTHSINGLTILSRANKSDFVLTELSSIPPSSFNAYYAGWNNSGNFPLKTVGIHHPQGDVKKISFDFKASISSGYYTRGNSHWQVTYWDLGTTEVISSGSPLFDERKMLVGQLHGGDASCQATDEEDYYGKFSYSWDYHSDSSRQTKYWLDPNNTGASAIPGYDPKAGKTDYDLAIFGFKEFNREFCGTDSITPTVLIKNRGNLQVNKVEVNYFLNNILTHSEVLNVTLLPDQFLTFIPSPFQVNSGFYSLKAEVKIPGQNDGNTSNNISYTKISVVNTEILVELTLKTDNDGNETSWELTSSTGSYLASGGDYPNITGGQIIKDTFCLYDGCFNFSIYDEYGDGICCDFGNGFYVLKNLLTGDTIIKDFNFQSSDTTHVFCLGDSCSIRANGEIKHASTGSSTDGAIKLEMLSGIPPFTFIWSNGDTDQSISNLSSGIYSVLVQDSINCSDSLFFEVGIGTFLTKIYQSSRNIVVFPNPTSAEITIRGLKENEYYLLQIFDMRGRILISEERKSSSGKIQLDISQLGKSMYFLRITGGMKTETLRIIKND